MERIQESQLLKIEGLADWRKKFYPSFYRDAGGHRQRYYYMNRDGFMLLVMGFTGEKALETKLRYIKQFNLMEQYIADRNKARLEYRVLTDAVMAVHASPQFYHYKNEADMINRIVLGMSAKEYQLAHGIPKDIPLRDCLEPWQVTAIERLQAFDAGLVETVPHYQQCKKMLQEYYDRLKARLLPVSGQREALPG